MFSVFVHTMNSDVPTLLLELSSDEATARRLAVKALAESPRRLLVEVREDDRLIFSLDRNGVAWIGPADQGADFNLRPAPAPDWARPGH
jgi:hypothetical protein